jgi:hypothetical protein
VIKLRRIVLSFLCGGAAVLGAAVASFAATPPKGGTIVKGPIFNPETNSYFALYKAVQGLSYDWSAAFIQAQRHFHDGERGHLAIVRDGETLEWVRHHFTISTSTWIGLRFFCKFRKLLWVDGRVQSPSAPGMWHSQWYRNDKINCNFGLPRNAFMPVYLTGVERGGTFWQASGPAKAFYDYLVEFPAAKKPEGVSQNTKEMTTMPTKAGTQ